jgi:hypothetical protein
MFSKLVQDVSNINRAQKINYCLTNVIGGRTQLNIEH